MQLEGITLSSNDPSSVAESEVRSFPHSDSLCARDDDDGRARDVDGRGRGDVLDDQDYADDDGGRGDRKQVRSALHGPCGSAVPQGSQSRRPCGHGSEEPDVGEYSRRVQERSLSSPEHQHGRALCGDDEHDSHAA